MLGALAFLLGVSVGSFVNVAADRLPGGRSLVRPRSFCESCNRTLTSLDLVPVVSYLWLRGRCRHCGARIPLRSPLVELSTGALFTLTYLRFGYSAETVVVCAALSILLIVTLIDLEHGLILNVIVFPTMAALVVLAPFWSELGFARPLLGSLGMPASLFNSLIAGSGAFAIFLAIALISPGGMGAGDVKFVGVLGLMLGFPGVLFALWLAVVTGGLVAATFLLLRKRGRKDAIPFGPFLALGAAMVLLVGTDLNTGYQEFAARLTGFWA